MTKRFELSFECENAAFDGEALVQEVETTLRRAIAQLADFEHFGVGAERVLRDSNGQRVGSWRFIDAQEASR